MDNTNTTKYKIKQKIHYKTGLDIKEQLDRARAELDGAREILGHLLQPCCYGVTSGLWDRVLRTGGHKVLRPATVRVHIPVVRRRG
mgnify:CR=1 FL=1